MWFMPSVPAPADPGWDGDPDGLDRDPMTAAEREAWLDRPCQQDDDPFDDPQEYWDPESCAPPPGGAGFSFTPASRDGPPGGFGTWRLRIPDGGPDLIVAIDTLDTRHCEHRYEARGHDPGVKLRHLSRARHATCTSPVCRRPARPVRLRAQHPVRGGRADLPVQRGSEMPARPPAQAAARLEGRSARRRKCWTTPAGRSYDTEPTRYPI
jgi:hypothetical protein